MRARNALGESQTVTKSDETARCMQQATVPIVVGQIGIVRGRDE